MSELNATATAAVRQALDLLSRASADWRNGGGCEAGPLHWPVAVHHARKRLQAALAALDGHEAQTDEVDLEDALRGSIWWNSISRTERHHWLEVADSTLPADAWRAFQAGGPRP